MKELSSIQSHAWNVQYDFTDANLASNAGISFVAYLAKASGLVGLLEGLNGTLKKRRRGATEAQSVLSQVYLLAMSEGHLSDLDDARQDWVFRVLTGLGEMPGSCQYQNKNPQFCQLKFPSFAHSGNQPL